jgi:UDP-N-acetylmuramoyl-L-alanyl-D-glutamate--2,6-diaminopimelate ligase
MTTPHLHKGYGKNGAALPPFDLAQLDALGVPVERLATDSRRVRPGDVFMAYPGERSDGRGFIDQALAAGAAAVLWERQGFDWDDAWRVPNLGVSRLKDLAGVIAGRVYGEPSAKLDVIGVTGTNGKTSCSHWLAQALAALGRRTAVIGTLGSGFPGALTPGANTTPDAVQVQEILKGYLDAGASAVAMEVSSHGLDQGRVNGVHFALALFTNLSRDHLDYHGDMETYGAVKKLLFTWPGLEHAVINLDDPFGQKLAHEAKARNVVGYGFSEKSDAPWPWVRGLKLAMTERGVSFDVHSPWGEARVQSCQLGRFNAANLLGVMTALLCLGVPIQDAAAALAKVHAVPGRLQQLGGGDRPLVVVDYAHTPDALEKVLLALREVVPPGGKLVCVFGCGGDRDRGKRPLMGGVASRLADRAIVTSDNPRSEEPLAIIDEILAGMNERYQVEPDRAAAIEMAVGAAAAGDVVLLAGKGHEDYQEIQGVRYPFSDLDVARRALSC